MRNELGKSYGLLVVEARDGSDRWGQIIWRCRCACGTIVHVPSRNLRRMTRDGSCGCASPVQRSVAATKHGLVKTIEYRAWSNMIDRCENKNNKSYPDYGGRGVKIARRWRASFSVFLDDITREIGLKPSSDHSLDRVDNSKGYRPGNVRWATRIEQARNKRTTLRLTVNGETLTLIEWSERVGVKYRTIRLRLESGWSPELALSPPRSKRST
jgi:hypothetical protein